MRLSTFAGFAAGAIATVAIMQPAQAAEMKAFTAEAFAAAQKEGRPILVDVHAPWCSVCARQQPLIERAAKDPANQNLVVFKLDFDTQKAEQRGLKVTKQATLIALDGKRETGRLLGATDAKEGAACRTSWRVRSGAMPTPIGWFSTTAAPGCAASIAAGSTVQRRTI